MTSITLQIYNFFYFISNDAEFDSVIMFKNILSCFVTYDKNDFDQKRKEKVFWN